MLELLLSLLAGSPGQVPQRPNVLLLVADDISHHELGFYRDTQPNPDPPPTPHLDRLASAGVRFTRAIANPICSPSRITILTGLHSSRARIGGNVEPHTPPVDLPLEFVTLPEALRSLGYATGAFGKWHVSNTLGPSAPQLHGFDAYRAGSLFNIADYYAWERIDDGVVTPTTEYSTEAIGDAFREWVRFETERPWFAYVAFHAPHGPYQAPPEHLLAGHVVPPEPTKRDLYEAMIVALDTVIGELLETLPENTLVVFLGDNGTPRDAKSVHQKGGKVKGSPFREGVEVPLLVWHRRLDRGTSGALVQLSDLYATILGLVDPLGSVPVPQDSISFLPQLFDVGRPGTRQLAFSDASTPNGSPSPSPVARAVTGERYKYTVHELQGGGFLQGFYDLVEDPEEGANLLISLTAEQKALLETYLEFLEESTVPLL